MKICLGGLGPTSPSIGGSNKTALIASLVAVLSLVIIAIALVVAVVFWRRRKSEGRSAKEDGFSNDLNSNIHAEEMNEIPRRPEEQKSEESASFQGNRNEALLPVDDADLYGNAEAIRYQPIPVNKFYQYVNEKKASPNSFMDEFRTIIHELFYKNRPVDQTMSMHRTFPHMMKRLKLTSLHKVKCHQYWPEKKEKYGPLTVNHHRCDVLADYVVRTFILTKDDQNENRQVYHFQYTSWPDKGVPQHATSVLGFRRKARAQYVLGASNAPLFC
ncbi:hypothetical protein QZH41_000773 [Actinostola sp. cb2023]|nr:hypothetical protein QZH41_000773 [Actinostola sp. cb2023]